ncbi:MAG TPA: DUF885 family protein [Gemmatimonadales bacterium]|nr:DUF885 family protein [Gemmatimonadales bacterium]
MVRLSLPARLLAALVTILVPSGLVAQTPSGAAAYVPPLATLLGRPTSELGTMVTRVALDARDLNRRWPVDYSPAQVEAFRGFYSAWQSRLGEVQFDKLSQDGKVDYILLRNRLGHELSLLARDQARFAEMAALLPFAAAVMDLHERQRRMLSVLPESAARAVAAVADQAARTAQRLDSAGAKPSRIVAYRAAAEALSLRQTLRDWYEFYAGYDPMFTWWVKAPYDKASAGLQQYARALREKIVGIKEGEDDPIIGDPIGRAALVEDLAYEMIPYGPEDLVKIAEREFAWCEAEMLKASRAMGFGDDWHAAMEKVKTLHVEPGKQIELVRDLAREAEAYVEQHNLVSVPPLARDDWWEEMLSPAQQKVSPFFLGGSLIQVSYPTDAMAQEDKMMTMRGNNIHFSRATVFHELIPGHHLQWFMSDRYQPHRDLFGTPFWTEGWSLYWEMLLYDAGFPRSPEDRVGMLFWRMHRAARIIFSLRFHLGTMTPQEAIDMLVNRVGHERANATAEVRRSFNGSYPPLYQIAYMMGGLQFRALHQELVGSGKMTDRAFHDAVLQSGTMPVEMVRALLTRQPLSASYTPQWKFTGTLQ